MNNPIMLVIVAILGLVLGIMAVMLAITFVVGTLTTLYLPVWFARTTPTQRQKVFGDVRKRLGRTILVSLAIFIGATGTIALFTVSDAIITQLREDVKEEELPMVTIFTAIGDETVTLDNNAYVEDLKQLDGVTEVIAFAAVPLQFKKSESAEDFENAFGIGFLDPYDALPITPIRLLEGTYPLAGESQVALDTRMAESYGLSVGDTLYMNVLSPSRNPDLAGEIATLEPFAVTGIVFDPYVSVRNVQGDSAIYMTTADAAYISAQPEVSGFAARFVDFPTAEDQKDTFADAVANDTPYLAAFTLIEDPEQSQLLTSVQTLTGTLSFLALISLVVSGFLVVNVVSSIVVEQKRQIGLMKSLGATLGDNYAMYSGIAFMYGLIAVIPAAILGIFLGDFFSHMLAPSIDVVLEGFQLSPSSIFLGILVGVVIPVSAAFWPVLTGTTVRILEAITDLGIDANYGSGPLARIIGVLPIPITIRQGLSNVSLKKGRLFFTMITLSIAVGAAMGIYAFFFNIQSGINLFLDSFNVQVLIAPNQAVSPERFQQILAENFQTEENNLLRNIEPGFQVQVEFEGYNPPTTTGGPPGIFAYGYDINSDDPAFNFTIDEGEQLNNDNSETGIIFSSALAENMGKQLGEQVVMKVPGNQVELTIVGISDYPLDQVWMDWETIALATGYTTSGDISSPLPIPLEAQSFIPYASVVNSGEGEITILGFSQEAGSFLGSFVSAGEFYEPNSNTLVVSQTLADEQGFAVGDSLTLSSTVDPTQTAEYTIAGILSLPPQMTGEDLPSDFAAMPWRELAILDGNTFEEKPRPVGYFITTNNDEATVREIDRVVDDMNEVLLAQGISTQNFNFVQLVDQINSGFTTVLVILQLVALLIAAVGALGLFTTLSMAVFERQKEIGVMRSIGAGSGTVALQFLTEGLVVGILAWVVGLPISFAIMLGLFEITGFGDTFAAEYPPIAALGGLLGMIIITFFASLWPSLSASGKTVSDILRYQ